MISRHFIVDDKENTITEVMGMKDLKDVLHSKKGEDFYNNLSPYLPRVTPFKSDLSKVRELIEKRLNQLNYDSTDEAMVNDKTIGAYLELLEFMDDLKQNH